MQFSNEMQHIIAEQIRTIGQKEEEEDKSEQRDKAESVRMHRYIFVTSHCVMFHNSSVEDLIRYPQRPLV